MVNSIYIFTRDFRLSDNLGLIKALKESKQVLPIFIFNPDQIGPTNKYRSNNAIQFMCESLEELNKELKKKGSRLFTFYGDLLKVVSSIMTQHKNITSIYISKDYTPYALKRESVLDKLCLKYNIKLNLVENHLLLNSIDSVKKPDNSIYMKFTPFYRTAKTLKVDKPIVNNHTNYYKSFTNRYLITSFTKFYKENNNISVRGGRSNALSIVSKLKEFSNYNKSRDYLSKPTTQLSAYIKFGLVSCREMYAFYKQKLAATNKLFTQLYWREFYTIVGYNHPINKGATNAKYNKLEWTNNKTLFKKWCLGQTGIPIVDAGMRQLNTTGFMHNRCRMIVSNILIKIFHVDWRLGEKYFAQKLVDYDPLVNNGSWQWSSGSGTDTQPFFRIFNPYLQSKKYDPECIYIKKWVPELESVPSKDIHNWFSKYGDYVDKNIYMKPIVLDLTKEKKITISRYKKLYV